MSPQVNALLRVTALASCGSGSGARPPDLPFPDQFPWTPIRVRRGTEGTVGRVRGRRAVSGGPEEGGSPVSRLLLLPPPAHPPRGPASLTPRRGLL